MSKSRDLADLPASLSTTEIGYLDGVTSDVQTQLDGKADLSGDTMTGALNFGDNVKAQFGAGNDLQIYHNGSNSIIADAGTGSVLLQTDGTGIQLNKGTTESMLVANVDGSVDLYYDNSKKLATTSTGVNVTGEITTDDLTATGAVKVQQIKEKFTGTATAATGTVNFDALTQQVLYYSTDATGNWTLNIRGDSSNTLNSIMSTGESFSVVFMVAQGATAYYQTGLTIDGSSVTTKWQGGAAPTAGNANSIDSYSVTIIKEGDASFTAFAGQVQYA